MGLGRPLPVTDEGLWPMAERAEGVSDLAAS